MKQTFSRRGGWSSPIKDSFRSGLEVQIANELSKSGVSYRYELDKVVYIIPASKHEYRPDFVLPNGVIIEGKGLFESEDRKKQLLIKAQYPNLDIRFVFSNARQKLYKGSPTTYAMWADKHGFKWANKKVPKDWLLEPQKDTTGLIPRKKGEAE
nr:hypothetical protein [uncultured Anaeromusa sp.]